MKRSVMSNMLNKKIDMNYISAVGIPRKEAKELIFDRVCRVFEVSEIELKSKRRYRHIVDAKAALCYVLHKERHYSCTSVGEFTKLNHATVLHHCKKAESLIKFDNHFRNKINRII